MARSRRMTYPGGTVFFTVTLAERGSYVLVARIGELLAACGAVAAKHPPRTEAIAVRPDHLHAVWTLPAGDTDYSVRWGAIKARFTRSVRDACTVGFNPPMRRRSGCRWGRTPPYAGR